MRPPRDKWTVVSHYILLQYPCGVRAGDRVRLLHSFDVKDHDGLPIGRSYASGGLWTVLSGNKVEPTIVWLKAPDGVTQTWDEDDFWDTFERV